MAANCRQRLPEVYHRWLSRKSCTYKAKMAEYPNNSAARVVEYVGGGPTLPPVKMPDVARAVIAGIKAGMPPKRGRGSSTSRI